MFNPDFAAVARAMGMKAYDVAHPDEVEDTLKRAFEEEGPVLVSIMTDENALAMPPKIEFEQMKGFAESMIKLVMAGRIDDVLDTAKSNFKHLRDLL